MKIQYCSDLHLEFPENLHLLNGKEPLLNAVGDVLVIAGDIGYLNDRTIPNLRLWKWMSDNFRQVLMVAGNHEFYNNGDITALGDRWQRMIKSNVGYYHNKVVHIDNTDFILSTLWTRISPIDEFYAKCRMNDYRQILYDGHRLVPANTTTEFEKNFQFIKNSVNNSTADKIVVVTHHLPTYAAIEECYVGDPLNMAFATELGNYIADSHINAWIYGHAHHITDLHIGDTHLVSNPLGYVFAGENSNFNPSAVLEL